MIYLKYSKSGVAEADFSSGTERITIGSSESNVVQISGEGVQATHAQIDAINLCITDLGSPTPAGLRINDEELTSAILENGDVIGIGDWTMRFFHTGEEYVSERDTRTLKVDSVHSRAPQRALVTGKQ